MKMNRIGNKHLKISKKNWTDCDKLITTVSETGWMKGKWEKINKFIELC